MAKRKKEMSRKEKEKRRSKEKRGVIEVGLTATRSVLRNAHATLRADVILGLSYWPTYHPIVKFLAMFPATFPDTDGGKLVTT